MNENLDTWVRVMPVIALIKLIWEPFYSILRCCFTFYVFDINATVSYTLVKLGIAGIVFDRH